MSHLPNIARLTKGLRVFAQIPAAAHDWNDVVENKFVRTPAPFARRAFPHFALKRSKVFAVSCAFTPEWFRKMGALGKHDISIYKPSLFQCSGNLGSRFRRVFVAFGWASLSLWGWSSSYGFAYPSQSIGAMVAAPEGIVFTHDGFASAPVRSACDALGSRKVYGTSINERTAYDARNLAPLSFGASFLAWNGISHNGVKSVETPLYPITGIRAIPSQAAQECVEGVTTRAWSPDRTVKPHERATRKGRDSLGCIGICRSVDKEPRDNTTDEVLNISPNSPISAAQFSFTQYAGAVSISGLEILQNSGKEALIDLLEGRVKIAEAQLMNRIDYDLYLDGTGNSSKNITGLAAAIPDAPTTGTYGGISRSSYTFWQSQVYDASSDGGAAVSAANIQTYMTSLALECVRGSDKPDLWVMDGNYYGFYVNSLQAIQRITSSDGSGAAGAGFGPELKFFGGGMSSDVVLGSGISGAVNTAGTSGGATANHAWALNTNYIFFRPHKDRNFVPIGGDRQSVNQDAVVKLIGWAGNMTSSGPQFSGVLIA